METFNIQDTTTGCDEVFVFSSQNTVKTLSIYPRDATDIEIHSLRHVIGPVPAAVWLVALAGAIQRFAYWGSVVPWHDYIRNLPDHPHRPGALGLGDSKTKIILNLFVTSEHIMSLPFGVLSDVWLGRYKTLLTGLVLTTMGCTILFVTSIPYIQTQPMTSVAGFATASVFISMGQAAAQNVIHPLLGDQLLDQSPRAIQTKTGEIVVIDRALTIQHIFNVYYWMVNTAALLSCSTTWLGKYVGFWAAYLPPACFPIVALIPLIARNGTIAKEQPHKNVLYDAAKVCLFAMRAGFQFSAASPAHQKMHHSRSVPWSLNFVNEIRRAAHASRIIFCFAIFWLCYEQLAYSTISQVDQMWSGSIPKDTFQTLNPITCMILVPLIQEGLFPWLHRRGISVSPVTRMATAFLLVALGLGYIAVTQRVIYDRGPCFDRPLVCPAALVSQTPSYPMIADSDGLPNDVSAWVVIPLHLILGSAEVLGVVSLNEYVYAQAPAGLKASLHSLQWLAAATGSLVSIVLERVSRDPWLAVVYGSLAGVMGCNALVFWTMFRDSDKTHLTDLPQEIEIV